MYEEDLNREKSVRVPQASEAHIKFLKIEMNKNILLIRRGSNTIITTQMKVLLKSIINNNNIQYYKVCVVASRSMKTKSI
jgi:hypothetical protein